jgi:preprotein translocase subunit SecE
MNRVMDRIKVIAEKVKQFLAGSKVELKKVTWPTPKQTLASTSVVIIVVIIVSFFLGIVDFGLTKIIKLVLG